MKTLAEQALDHPNIDDDDVWNNCFGQFDLHPYSDIGIPYSGGLWQVDGGYACVFKDGSRVNWDESSKEWKLGNPLDLDEELSSFTPEEAEEIRQRLSVIQIESEFFRLGAGLKVDLEFDDIGNKWLCRIHNDDNSNYYEPTATLAMLQAMNENEFSSNTEKVLDRLEDGIAFIG